MTTPVRAFREQRERLSPQAIDYFQTGKLNAWSFLNINNLESIWQAHRDAILEDWVKVNPGTRPAAWWEWDAPTPRLRLGGTGTPIQPDAFAFGIPKWWCDEPLYGPGVILIDPNDPPVFESEATYLKRLNLLAPGEAKRLTKADFENELIR